MHNSIEKHGSCLCGNVSISIFPEKAVFDACHCGMCRKWGGGPALTVEGGESFEIKGQDFVTVYDSSDWAQRAFCKTCGTHLFYRLKNSTFCNFPLGLFENTEDFKFQMQIYVDDKPSNYEFANKTEMMTEAEVIAKFSSTSS